MLIGGDTGEDCGRQRPTFLVLQLVFGPEVWNGLGLVRLVVVGKASCWVLREQAAWFGFL
ncbi:hypothetical protein GCM10023263_94970 [Phytohabitans rumicis]